MNNELRGQINELAEDILEQFNIAIPIKNMRNVVEQLGGRIEDDDSLGQYSDGVVEKDNDTNTFFIRVSSRQSDSRRNFTIAHELGHLFIHMGYMIDSDLWNESSEKVFNRKGNSEIELQANEFAAAFLMPSKEYKKIIDKYSEGNTVFIAEVAKYFNVSIEAASYRGKWLGYLEWI